MVTNRLVIRPKFACADEVVPDGFAESGEKDAKLIFPNAAFL